MLVGDDDERIVMLEFGNPHQSPYEEDGFAPLEAIEVSVESIREITCPFIFPPSEEES